MTQELCGGNGDVTHLEVVINIHVLYRQGEHLGQGHEVVVITGGARNLLQYFQHFTQRCCPANIMKAFLNGKLQANFQNQHYLNEIKLMVVLMVKFRIDTNTAGISIMCTRRKPTHL